MPAAHACAWDVPEPYGSDWNQELIKTPERLRPALVDMTAAVLAHVPPVQMKATLKRLLPRRFEPCPGDLRPLHDMALDLLMFAPDSKGRTGFHRLRQRRRDDADHHERAALDLLCRASFAVLQVTNDPPDEAGRVVAEDLLTEQAHVISIPGAGPRDVIAGRIALAPDGVTVPVGLVLELPDVLEGLPAEADAWDRRSSRFANRLAEAVYRLAVEAVMVLKDPLDRWMVDTPTRRRQREITFRRGRVHVPPEMPGPVRDLVALAEQWAAWRDGEPAEADTEGATWLRGIAEPDHVHLLLLMAQQISSDRALVKALEAMAAVMLDVVERRATLGFGETMEEYFAIDEDGREPDPGVLERLERLRAHTGARGRAGGTGELDRVITRIRALQAKTQEAGCTEAEAMAAAAKAEELLRRYDISLTPEQLAAQECAIERVPTARKRHEGLDDCAPAVARFCECWTWTETDAEERLTHVFFGMPADVAAARALYELIETTFQTETARFKTESIYAETPSPWRGQATRSFRLGLGSGIGAKLKELEAARLRHTMAATGRDLVPLKTRTMEEALDRLGVRLETRTLGSRSVDAKSFRLGQVKGRAFQPGTPVAEGRA